MNNSIFECVACCKTAELDNFENGCTGDVVCFDIDARYIKGSSLDCLKEQIAVFCGADSLDAVEVFEDDNGRIDCAVMENADGYQPSSYEYELFKAGKIDLYYCVYSFYFDAVSSQVAKFN